MPGEATQMVCSTAPFRVAEFRSKREFESYLKANARLMANRWLYEQSLASPANQVVLAGTCGLCLDEVEFTSATKNGEMTGAGCVPNWREGMVCSCERRLINRQRALLHYLLKMSALEPWMRVLGLGDMAAMEPMLKVYSAKYSCEPGDLHAERGSLKNPNYHLIVSAEQLNRGMAEREYFSVLSQNLVPGGQFVFTAAFDPHDSLAQSANPEGPCDWSLIPRLLAGGFSSAKACLYWSEEYGYLGPRNFIFVAKRI
jgi:hypothetical protein